MYTFQFTENVLGSEPGEGLITGVTELHGCVQSELHLIIISYTVTQVILHSIHTHRLVTYRKLSSFKMVNILTIFHLMYIQDERCEFNRLVSNSENNVYCYKLGFKNFKLHTLGKRGHS